jgi:hypothetical protein
MGQRPPCRDTAGTSAGTTDLKALAHLVLARDNKRDSNRDALSRDRLATSATVGQIEQPFLAADRAPATWGEVQEERAAIVERDGGIPREWSEGFARLHPDHPPPGVPPKRWLRFCDDVGLFVDRWARYAAALGWRPLDLFGCDRDLLFDRINQVGLLWLLNGDKLIALSEHTATIETRTGVRQTYRRKPSEHGRVLAWELGVAARHDADH